MCWHSCLSFWKDHGRPKRPGIRVLRARNITEAIDLLSRSYVPVDLVISNSALAETSPCDVAGLVHEVRPTIPLLFMSPMAVTRDIPAGRNGEGAAVQEQATVEIRRVFGMQSLGRSPNPSPPLRAMGAVWSFQRGL